LSVGTEPIRSTYVSVRCGMVLSWCRVSAVKFPSFRVTISFLCLFHILILSRLADNTLTSQANRIEITVKNMFDNI
jgi:hypothetical protein